MISSLKRRILVVDDEPVIRDVISNLLHEAECTVSTAEHGFDALRQLRADIPDLIICDLNMPRMSGFEFLSIVRRRFPEIPVIAISGAYQSGDHVPGGVIADAFFAKGQIRLKELLVTVADLIQTSAARAVDHHRQSAPVWVPRNGKDSNGVPFIVLTYGMFALLCVECAARRHSGDPGNTMPLLRQSGPVHHRLFPGRFVAEDTAGKIRRAIAPFRSANVAMKATES